MKRLLPLALTVVLLTGTSVCFAQQPVAQQPTATTSAADLKEYAGTYKFAENGYFTTLTLTVANGKLYGQIDSNEKYEYVRQPTQPDTFKSTSSYGSLFTFTRDAASKQVTGFKMKIMENELTGTREK